MANLAFSEKARYFWHKIKDSQSLTGASFHLIIAQSVGFLTLFALDLWLVRVLTKSEFGTWKQFLWGVRFFVPLFFLGLPESYRYFSATDRANYTYHFYRILILITGIWVWLQFLEQFHLFHYFSAITQNLSFNKVTFWIPLLILVSAVKFLLRIHAIFVKQTFTIILSNIVFSIILIIVGFILVHQRQHLLLVIVTGWIGGEVFRILYYSIALRHTLTIPAKWWVISFKQLKRYFAYGIPYYFSTTIFLLFLNVDKIVVSKFGGVEQFAVFSLAAIEIPFLTAVFVSVSQNLFPRLAQLQRENSEKAFSLWLEVFKKVSYLIYPIIIVLLWIARPLFLLLFTQAYEAGIEIFRVYILLLLWRTASYSILLNASGKPHVNLLINGLFLTFNFSVSIMLFPVYGMLGVVWVTFISFMMMNFAILFYLKKIIPFFQFIWQDKVLFGLITLIVLSFIGSEIIY